MHSFNRLFAPDSPSSAGAAISFVETVEAVDDYTVQFVLNSPNADLALWITSREFGIVPHDRSDEELATTPSGTGPFQMAEFLVDERATLTRNENYWGDQGPYVDELHFVYMPEIATQVSALTSGEIDIIWQIGFETIAALEGNPDVQVVETGGGGHQAIVMRVNDEPFNNPLIRQAVKHCVDREGMRQVVLQGRGELGNDQPIPPANTYWAGIEPYAYDTEQAKALLTEAGYPDGIELTLYTSTARPGMVEAAVVLQETAKPAGITINIEQVPPSNYWSEIWLKVPFCVSNWSMGITADQILSEQLHSASEWNESDFRDERVDEAIEAARVEVDPEKRQALYTEAQRIVVEEGGLIIAYFRPSLSATRANVQGFHPTPVLDMDFRSVQLT